MTKHDTFVSLPKGFGDFVRARRIHIGMPLQKDMFGQGISKNTLKAIEGDKKPTIGYYLLCKLAEILNLTLQEILHVIEKIQKGENTQNAQKWFFNYLFDSCSKIDRYLINSLRHHYTNTTSDDYFYQNYKDLINIKLSELLRVDTSEFLNTHTIEDKVRDILNTLPSPKLTININDDFSTIVFESEYDPLHVSDPQVMWPCSCNTSPIHDCEIHSSTNGERIADLMQNDLVEIKWRGYSFLWKYCEGLWPPSIDSFYFLESIPASYFKKGRHVNKLLDIGCGTGFLGLILGNLLYSKEVYLSDWTCTSYLFSIINYFRNDFSNKVKLHFRLGMDYSWINGSSDDFFDLAICNPPYLPIPNKFHDLRAMHTVAGTDLLEKILSVGTKYSKDTLIQFSNTAECFLTQKKDIKQDLSQYKIEHSGRRIPFRVSGALEVPEYIDWLRTSGLIVDNKSKFLYFHEISMYEMHTS